MRIGIDFDNTIVCYDNSFFQVALEKKWIEKKILKTKVAVKNFMQNNNLSKEFTILQGLVYGKEILKAKVFDGFKKFIYENKNNYEFFIISHKTKYPIIGEKTDLHSAAYRFLKFNKLEYFSNNLDNKVFLELTKEEKIKRTNLLDLDYFIDDLLEILNMEGYLEKTKKLLFNPNRKLLQTSSLTNFNSWEDINNYFKNK